MTKTPKSSSKKKKFGLKYKWFKMSYLEFSFWKYYFGYATFIYLPRRSVNIIRVFFNFRFSSRKTQNQQKLAKKITHFVIQFRSKNLTCFTKLNSLDIENNIHPQHSQKTFWLYKFSIKHVSVWCQKKIFPLHHFAAPKNCILEALWK